MLEPWLESTSGPEPREHLQGGKYNKADSVQESSGQCVQPLHIMHPLKGTRCLGLDELVYEKCLKLFVIKCIWLERYFKSRI